MSKTFQLATTHGDWAKLAKSNRDIKAPDA